MPIDSHSQARRGLVSAVAAVVLATLVLVEAWLKFDSYQDDAFIFFRYADNVLSGQGVVFNLGKRGHPGVQITTPLSVTEVGFTLHAATCAAPEMPGSRRLPQHRACFASRPVMD